jgi:integrase
MLVEKPSGWSGRAEALFFEVSEGALLLEAARVLEMRDRGSGTTTPGLHAIVATFLLTGGRKSEVLGLDVEDVSFDRGVIHFRPNAHSGLKTKTSVRTVPLWAQLRDILQGWMYGGDSPRTHGLLLPAYHGGRIRNLRKSLDAIGEMCGMDEGEVRTGRFRHTYCSVRLATVQRIVKPGKDPATDPDPYEYVEVSKFQVQKEMGHGGAQLVDRIYGHGLVNPHRLEAVEYKVERHREELGERLRALEVGA